jgi:hypothetical protein
MQPNSWESGLRLNGTEMLGKELIGPSSTSGNKNGSELSACFLMSLGKAQSTSKT